MTPEELAKRIVELHREREFDAGYEGKGANEEEAA